MWMGIRLWRLGRSNVSWPSPPYVVPMSWKSTSFSAMGSVCPSQNIQPAGAKLPANILISPTYGSGIVSPPSGLGREDALERDDEVQHQVRHHVCVRLAAADVGDRRRLHRRQVGRGTVEVVERPDESAARVVRPVLVNVGGVKEMK